MKKFVKRYKFTWRPEANQSTVISVTQKSSPIPQFVSIESSNCSGSQQRASVAPAGAPDMSCVPEQE